MKSLLSGLLLGCGAVLAAGEVFRCEFSPAELKKWSMPPEAACMREGDFNFVRFTVPEAKKEPSAWENFLWFLSGLLGDSEPAAE